MSILSDLIKMFDGEDIPCKVLEAHGFSEYLDMLSAVGHLNLPGSFERYTADPEGYQEFCIDHGKPQTVRTVLRYKALYGALEDVKWLQPGGWTDCQGARVLNMSNPEKFVDLQDLKRVYVERKVDGEGVTTLAEKKQYNL